MRIGTRIIYPEDLDLWNAEVVQISVYNGMDNNISVMKDSSRACRNKGIPYVIHPVRYSLLEKDSFLDVMEMAEWAGLGLILHDETEPSGARINGETANKFVQAVKEIKALTHISFENASNTADVRWFWDSYADSITLDIGHVESAGIDSMEFISSLNSDEIKKIDFVHIHRNNGMHGGITDHWPLKRDCRELSALKKLLQSASDFSVLLEINEVEEISDSLELLRELREGGLN